MTPPLPRQILVPDACESPSRNSVSKDASLFLLIKKRFVLVEKACTHQPRPGGVIPPGFTRGEPVRLELPKEERAGERFAYESHNNTESAYESHNNTESAYKSPHNKESLHTKQGIYAECPHYLVLYMRSVLSIQCFICEVFLLFSALYAKCPYYSVLCMQSVLIIQ